MALERNRPEPGIVSTELGDAWIIVRDNGEPRLDGYPVCWSSEFLVSTADSLLGGRMDVQERRKQ
jgi:hypothetical protein